MDKKELELRVPSRLRRQRGRGDAALKIVQHLSVVHLHVPPAVQRIPEPLDPRRECNPPEIPFLGILSERRQQLSLRRYDIRETFCLVMLASVGSDGSGLCYIL